VLCEGRVPRERALQLLNEAGVALISASNQRIANPAVAGIITGKIFEVLACRKPYLVIAPENSDLHSVVRTAGGGRIFTSDNIAGMADYLDAVMSGNPPAYADPSAYSWETLARRMSEVLLSETRK
jgi:glycosyltransferase involved in cell wall biosynthesis